MLISMLHSVANLMHKGSYIVCQVGHLLCLIYVHGFVHFTPIFSHAQCVPGVDDSIVSWSLILSIDCLSTMCAPAASSLLRPRPERPVSTSDPDKAAAATCLHRNPLCQTEER
jgi:hypothetical protein